MKNNLIDGIEIHQSKGLKSVHITSLNTYNGDSLIVEFVSVVNPKYQQLISNAIRRALVTLDVSLYLSCQPSFSSIIFFLAQTNTQTITTTTILLTLKFSTNICIRCFWCEKKKECHYKVFHSNVHFFFFNIKL